MARYTETQELSINVVGGSTFGRYARISNAKTYNMFVTASQNPSERWLVNFPGYKKNYTFSPGGTGRGQYKSTRGDFLVCVVAENVYRIDSNFNAMLVGSLSTYAGHVYIEENLSFQICIVDGVNAYIYNYSTLSALTVQTLNPNLTPNYIEYHNTFFLFGNSNQTNSSASWFAYAFDTATTIVEVSELALQTKPDYPIAIERIPGQAANVLVMGTAVCEIHTQVGGAQNYRRNNSISIDYGCLSIETIAASDLMIAWLASNENNEPVIMVFSAEGAIPISTDGIDHVLSTINHPTSSVAMFGRFDGHLFYQITFYHPADNLTLVYDFDTQTFFHLSDQHLNYHPAIDYSVMNNKVYFLSLTNASIYNISSDHTIIDENIVTSGHPDYNPALAYEMQRIRVCENYSLPTNLPFMCKGLSLILEQGHDDKISELSTIMPPGMITEFTNEPPDELMLTENGVLMLVEGMQQGELYAINSVYNPYVPTYQPKVELSISKDGGVTWSNSVSRTMRPLGFRKNMMTWERLGRMNVVTFKFRFWSRSRFVVNNATAWIKA